MGDEHANEKSGGESISTYFAPAERATDAEIREATEFVKDNPILQAILESLDGYLMVLNKERQVLAVNPQMMQDLGVDCIDCLAGERPGEILNCIHAQTGPGGCGTSKHCASCGAVISILASQERGESVTDECLATVLHNHNEESLEFRVRATPIAVGEHEFTVLTFSDISGDKRRRALERTFFHDILNTVGGLMGWSSLMQGLEGLDSKETSERILHLSHRLKKEIEDQRKLLDAENGTLDIDDEPIAASILLDGICSVFEASDVAEGRSIEVTEVNKNEIFVSDPTLLDRILTNMTKNALEAIREGETVELSFVRREGHPLFRVKNPGVIPDQIQLQLFKRSFSTKASAGRGIGTYSMKLFGERYLGGKVGFDSTIEDGTTFWIELPIK